MNYFIQISNGEKPELLLIESYAASLKTYKPYDFITAKTLGSTKQLFKQFKPDSIKSFVSITATDFHPMILKMLSRLPERIINLLTLLNPSKTWIKKSIPKGVANAVIFTPIWSQDQVNITCNPFFTNMRIVPIRTDGLFIHQQKQIINKLLKT